MSSMEMATIEGGRRLTLPAVLDLLAAEGLREALKENIVLGGRLEIDAAQVERLSTPCAQVLVAAGRAMADGGLVFSLNQPSETFLCGFADLGLSDVLAEWSVRP